MKSHSLVLLAGLAISTNAWAVGATTGYVTPSEMTITFTELRLIKSDNKQLTLLSGTFPHTFKKSDSGFASVSLSSIIAPAGRFVGVQVCYNTERTVKLSGDKYHGTNGATCSNGNNLQTTGTGSAVAAAAVSVGSGTGNTLSGFTVGNGTNNCSASYFARPVCVTSDSSSCESGDSVVLTGTTVPNLNLLLDMYNSVGVDCSDGSLDSHIAVYPYPTIGNPGAAFHFKYAGATDTANMTLLFSSDRKLLYSAAWGTSTSSTAKFCSGNGFVTATSAPAGAYLNAYGPTAVQSYDSGSSLVQFAAGNCGSGSTCTSNGINQVNGFPASVAGTVTVGCVADSAATPANLGFGYTAGAGVSGTVSWNVQRITDPSNIFGVCASGTCVAAGDTYYP
ncbi:MAG: hypothetical protein JNL01_13375 [Bdellovibrionales bacterium]|nr:hypothetical protein [Bdellovibrionales bacterium]